MDSAMRRFEIQTVGGIGGGFADPNGPRPRVRSSLAVALLLGARQRRLGPGLKGAGKVGAGPRVPFCYSPVLCPGSGPTEAVCRAYLLWLGSRPSGRLSNAVDCLQCSTNAAGRWGGDLVLCP